VRGGEGYRERGAGGGRVQGRVRGGGEGERERKMRCTISRYRIFIVV